MLGRKLELGVPFTRVAGVKVHGNDRSLQLWLERGEIPRATATKSNEKL